MKWIAVDFGTSSIKLLKFSLDGQRVQIEGFETFPSKPEFYKGLGQVEPAAWSALTIHLNELEWLQGEGEVIVTSSLAPAYTEARYIRFPFRSEKQIDKVLSFELESLIPFDLEDVQTRREILPADVSQLPKNEAIVLGLCYKRDLIKQFELELRKFELSIPPFTSQILTLLALRQAIQEEGVYGILELGHTKSQLIICTRSSLIGLRTFWWGGQNLQKALMEDLDLSQEKSQAIIENLKPDETPPAPVMKSILHFGVELRQTLKSMQAQGIRFPDSLSLYCFGKPLQCPGLIDQLQKEYKNYQSLDPKPFPFEHLAQRNLQHLNLVSDLDAALPALAMALLQVRPHRQKIPTFSETSFQFQQNLKRIKQGGYAVLRRVALLLIAPFLYALLHLYVTSQENDQVLKGIREIVRQTGIRTEVTTDTGRLINDFKKVIAANRSKIAQLEEDQKSALAALSHLSEAIPASLKIDIRELTINESQVLLTAETDSENSAQRISSQLKRRFSNVSISPTKPCDGNRECVIFSAEMERTQP